jgi:hypothetical protein
MIHQDIAKLFKLSNELDTIFNIENNPCKNCSERDNSSIVNIGCCAECVVEEGYFESNNKYQIKLLKLIYRFNHIYGFFDIKYMNCKLPRYIRSRKCSWYMCDKLKMYIDAKKRNTIINEMTNIKKKIGILW